MTPQDQVQPIPNDSSKFESLLEIAQFELPPDDEPFELPECHVEEAIALLRFWREDESDTEEQRETLEILIRAGVI